MRIETLPSPGLLSNAIDLRAAAARAISNIEIAAGRNAGITSGANALHTFFTACATAVASLRDLVAPTVLTRVAPAGQNILTITHSEGLDRDYIPAVTAFTIAGAPANSITRVEISGARLILTGAVNFVPGTHTVAYTKPTGPSALPLRDPAGNEVASYTAQAIAAS